MAESESGVQQYCLRWNNHSESIISEFEILLDQEDFVDVTLSCSKQSLKAHKVVLSACSAYFRRLLKENPCQHPIIILRDIGYNELAAILHFMYHGQVMVEQERIPQLLQTAQMLEVRGLCEVRESESGKNNSAQEEREASSQDARPKAANHSFLAGLLGQTNVSATKRPLPNLNSNSCSNSHSNPSASKRQRSSSRPVPMLQSILSQQLASPANPIFDLAKGMGSSTRALTALASKVQGNSSNAVSTSTSSAMLPSSLENLLGGLASTSTLASAADRTEGKCSSHCSTTSFQDEDTNDRDAGKVESSSCGELNENRDSGHEGADLEPDTVVQIKEEPILDFEDDFCDDSDTRGGATGDEEGQSESENETGIHSESNSRGEASLLPLLAQHLAAPSLLSASAKLRAAASQARSLHSIDSPLIAQALLAQPSTPPDMGPASMGFSSDIASPSGEPPRKLAFHEPRPCPICRRMYRDAATLRTHTAIMHAEGRDPFACLCGELFRTKYEMYTHKKNGHR